MSLNKYQPHLLVLPEDDANRQIARGFILNPNLNTRLIQILPPVGGWGRVVETFLTVSAPSMRQFPKRMVVLLMDFDDRERRRSDVERQIPADLKERVFILGVQSEPEKLKMTTEKTFEKIGEALAADCADSNCRLWEHDLLKHNKAELDRMVLSVRPFLFN